MTTDYEKISGALRKIALGFIILTFHIDIEGFSVIPTFLGYYMFAKAIETLSEEERELKLLYKMSDLLFYYQFIYWFAIFVATIAELDIAFLQPIDLIFAVINIYYQFQLLTNLSSVAKKHSPETTHSKMLKGCRTLQTLILTMLNILNATSRFFGYEIYYVKIGFAIVYFISVLCCISAVLSLKSAINKKAEAEKADGIT